MPLPLLAARALSSKAKQAASRRVKSSPSSSSSRVIVQSSGGSMGTLFTLAVAGFALRVVYHAFMRTLVRMSTLLSLGPHLASLLAWRALAKRGYWAAGLGLFLAFSVAWPLLVR